MDRVEVEMHPYARRTFRFSDPQFGEQAKFSVEHALGAALVDRKPELSYLRPFSDAGAVDPRYKEARKKIKVILSAGREEGVHTRSAPVTVKLKDGRTYSKSVEVLKGSPEMPLSKEELVARYRNCVKGILSSQQMQRSIDLVFNLENLDNILELMELVTFGYTA